MYFVCFDVNDLCTKFEGKVVLFFLKIYADNKRFRVMTRKEKNQDDSRPIPIPGPESLTIIDMSSCNGRKNHARYHEIYNLFQNEEYPTEDEDINEYMNIRKIGIHIVVARPMIFPYNDVG
jgi:hypothetical protein